VNTPRRGARILAACLLSLYITSAHSSELVDRQAAPFAPDPVALNGPDLEQAFWACDHLATTRGPDATPVDFCAAVYDELKKRKFGGDFTALLGWWKVNKVFEHDRLTNGVGSCHEC
jgi:hypothetical protein